MLLAIKAWPTWQVRKTINYSYSTVQKLKQVIGPLSVQCNLPFQHKLKCKIQTGSAGDKRFKDGGKERLPCPSMYTLLTPSVLLLGHCPHHSQQQRKEHDEASGARNLPELGVSMHCAMNACRSVMCACSCVWACRKTKKLQIFKLLLSLTK